MNHIRKIIIAIVVFGALFASAWNGPTDTPPNGNVDTLLNTSNETQTKSGYLYFPKWFDSDDDEYYVDPDANSIFARIYANLDMRAPKFFDLDDPDYYVDPASISKINNLTVTNITATGQICDSNGCIGGDTQEVVDNVATTIPANAIDLCAGITCLGEVRQYCSEGDVWELTNVEACRLETGLCGITGAFSDVHLVKDCGTGTCSETSKIEAVCNLIDSADCSVSFSPAIIQVGETTKATWSSNNDITRIDYVCSGPIPGINTVGPSGSVEHTPTSGGIESCTLTPYNGDVAGTPCSGGYTVDDAEPVFLCSQSLSEGAVLKCYNDTLWLYDACGTIVSIYQSCPYGCTSGTGSCDVVSTGPTSGDSCTAVYSGSSTATYATCPAFTTAWCNVDTQSYVDHYCNSQGSLVVKCQEEGILNNELQCCGITTGYCTGFYGGVM